MKVKLTVLSNAGRVLCLKLRLWKFLYLVSRDTHIEWKTRKHSSRMRTALLQTICALVAKTRCCSWGVGGLCLKWTSLNRSPVLATRCQSGGRGCTVSSKASWIMVTCAPPSGAAHCVTEWQTDTTEKINGHMCTPLGVHMCYRMDRQTRLKRLPSGNSVGGR